MSMAIVTLKKGEGRTLKAGGAWIYVNEIEMYNGKQQKTGRSCWCMILTAIRLEEASLTGIRKSGCG